MTTGGRQKAWFRPESDLSREWGTVDMRRVDLCRSFIRPLLGAAVVVGCGGPGASTAQEPQAGSRAAGDQRASCVATYAAKPCDLLGEALVREHVPAAPAALERTDIGERLASLGVSPRRTGGIAQNGCRYEWDRGRTVALTSIQTLDADDPVARFERKWRTPTDADRELLAKRMDEGMDEARREGKLTEDGADLGKEMGRSFAGASISYEPVEGVGTRARWGGLGSERELRVLDGDTEFAVTVVVSDDEATNRELAIALARDLLARCD